MAITALPTPPSRQDPTNFPTRADAFMAALPTFATEATALQVDVNAKQMAAAASQAAAATSETNAAASAATAVNARGTTATLIHVQKMATFQSFEANVKLCNFLKNLYLC